MNPPFEIHWAEEARQTFDRLPQEVQNAFTGQLPGLVAHYSWLYPQRPEHLDVVGNKSHLQAPIYNLWLRMGTEYGEKGQVPILFVTELSELSPAEFEQSVQESRVTPDRINPR
ncbi:hypothetical protein [Larkinella terrae]|uniref:Uncharacterized protein n=1 Tax=Larkinella terrae TaxID=2025311 RepID=A0A7K0EQT4_9BACT|nr:hypothetical protein [Larkinella terrae]MRS63798.1 hypothetical protein [Larkinella terrae]